MEYQLLKPEIISKLLDLRLSREETNQFAGEAQEMEEDKQDDKKNMSKPKLKCYLLVTEICFYYVTKESLRVGKGQEVISLFDINDVVLNQSDFITLKFKKKTFYFMLANAAALMTNILLQVKKLAWNITPGQIFSFKEIFANSNYQKMPDLVKRPPKVLLFRYLSTSVAKEASFDHYLIKKYIKYDEDPRVVINLSDIEPSLPLAAMFPLTLESNIRKVSLDKFSSNDLGHTLNWVLSQQNNFDSVDLCKYDEVSLKGLNIRKSVFNHLHVVRFKSCTSTFITLFLNAIKNVNYSIDTIIFDDIRFDNDASNLLVQCMPSYTFFSSLRSLAFVGCQCASSSFFDLSISCLKSLDQLDNFTLDNCFIDINEVLMEIAKCDTPVQNISLRRNTSTSVIGHEDTILTNSILSLNVGDSEWTEEALVSFMSSICRRLRRFPLALFIDSCRIDSTWSEVFERFPIESLLPVITELNISNNFFNSKAFSLFLTFLETQAPFQMQSNKKLTHLDVSYCFNENWPSQKKKKEINPKDEAHSKECVSRLIDFFTKRDLWGLGLCGCRPNKDLINIKGLHWLNIGDNIFDRESINTLETLVLSSPTLTELGIDNIEFPDVKTMMQFYSQMFTYSKILAFEPLNSLFIDYPEYNETKQFKEFLDSKRRMSNPRQRMSLYLTLSEDFATHVAQDIKYSEEDESVAEVCTQTRLLIETQFSDPIPSLFTLATLNPVDLSVDPIASMVAEYAATSGKYGIIPPTNAPPDEPNESFMIPSVFSTNSTQNELEGENSAVEVDLLSRQNVALSNMIADEIQKSFIRNIVGFKEIAEFEVSYKARMIQRNAQKIKDSGVSESGISNEELEESLLGKRSPLKNVPAKFFESFRPFKNVPGHHDGLAVDTDTEIDVGAPSSFSSDYDENCESSSQKNSTASLKSQRNNSEADMIKSPGKTKRVRKKVLKNKSKQNSQDIETPSNNSTFNGNSQRSPSSKLKSDESSKESTSNPLSPSSADIEEIESRKKNQKKK